MPEIPDAKAKGETVRRLMLKAKTPWNKLLYVISGVIGPLKEKGFPPEITIEINVETDREFDKNTLDTKVKDTLQQIGLSSFVPFLYLFYNGKP